jgi:uncharacterized protein
VRQLFADSYYFFAWVNEYDNAHRRALEFSQVTEVAPVTTSWVLAEVADGMCKVPTKRTFLRLLNKIESNPLCEVIPPSKELFDLGLDLFSKRLDKDWSLTDCISFVVMERFGLQEALTGDHHFEQAGFKPLFAETTGGS